MKTVILLSGGIDSAVCLALMRGQSRIAIGFDYGQEHIIELDRARKIADGEGVPFQRMTLPRIGKSSDVVFAGRNAILLAVAVSYAVTNDADCVVIGSNLTDYDRFPDCRRAFIDPMSMATAYAYGVTIKAPLLDMTKGAVVAKARALGVDITQTWSCYRPMLNDLPCGTCLACQVRSAAL